MGCDIHEYVECLIEGEWVYTTRITVYRNYALFGVLAGVRDDEIECVTGENRELPDDCDPILAEMGECEDWHSHSYLYLDELKKAKQIYEEYMANSQYGRDNFPIDLTIFERLLALPFVQDVRFTFWFDN